LGALALSRFLPKCGTRRRLGGAFLLCGIVALLAFAMPPLAHPVGAQQIGARQNGVVANNEPVSPLPMPPLGDQRRIALGERLFHSPQLSRDGSRSCNTCHDVEDNGASRVAHDMGINGKPLPLNTLTVFNAAASFRFSWTGKHRTLEEQAKSSIESPRIMDTTVPTIAEKLGQDPEYRRLFVAAYGRGPDEAAVLDAIATYERSLLTPGSRFDRWLQGDATAMTPDELNGYQLFKSLGCVSCHQGVNIGGNLFQRHGIFHPLGSPEPVILRVPSLRNVAVTAPYFHDGSAATLEDAVEKMGYAQLNTLLQPDEVEDIVAFLKTLTGNIDGHPVGAGRTDARSLGAAR
jgi:cytochrome c peroxidase